MQKQTVEFAVQTKGNIVEKIGKSSVLVSKIEFKGGEIKFFDDSKLLKENRK
jgi:hypothetical protein